MDKIWAPWRIKYITQKKTKGCIFCNIFRENNDKKNYVILRSKYCFAIFNTFPYNNGHIMIIPNRHIKSLEQLTDEEILDMNKTLIKMKLILKKILNPGGFNIGLNIGKLAGAGVDKHIHTHLVPRWLGDTNFMPVIAETKIISQSIKALYMKCEKELQGNRL